MKHECQYSATQVSFCPRHGRCEYADVESNICEYDDGEEDEEGGAE